MAVSLASITSGEWQSSWVLGWTWTWNRNGKGKGIHGNMNMEHREWTTMDVGNKETSAIR
jgi:hypothetical protein